MKKIFTLLIGILCSITIIYAQDAPPQAFSYQAIIMKANGNSVLSNTSISLRISILQGSTIGVPVYTQSVHPTTDSNGQINIVIGGGTSFSSIDWSLGQYFLKVEVDIKGNTNYQLLSTTQLLSVPYAMYAGKARDFDETDPVFKSSSAFLIHSNDITNWNTAYGWGPHVGLYKPLNYVPTWDEITGKPITPGDVVTLTGNQTISGEKAFTSDLLVSGLTVGLGKGANTSNIAFGSGALRSNTTGNCNLAIGFEALALNTTGGYNIAIGIQSLENNTTGRFNTAIGIGALIQNTIGESNTALGRSALGSNTTGNMNTAFGDIALARNTTGFYNTAYGAQSLSNNTDGKWNSSNGYIALESNTTGNGNTASGLAALTSNTTGNFNTANGLNALEFNTTGENNTALGKEALYRNTIGAGNTVIGYDAGYTNTIGNNNVFLGSSAGYWETGSNKLFIDNQKRADESDARNKALIYGIFDGDPANQVLNINANVGISTLNPVYKLDVGGDINFTGNLYQNGNPFSSVPSIDGSETKITEGNGITITGVGTVENPYVINTKSGGGPGSGGDLSIGQHYGGGIIFYLTPDKTHGLVVATQDIPIFSTWYYAQNNISNPANQNTEGKQYTDWKLPTWYELDLLEQHKSELGLPSYIFWSSTETNGSNAIAINFGTNITGAIDKNTQVRVRAIRSF